MIRTINLDHYKEAIIKSDKDECKGIFKELFFDPYLPLTLMNPPQSDKDQRDLVIDQIGNFLPIFDKKKILKRLVKFVGKNIKKFNRTHAVVFNLIFDYEKNRLTDAAEAAEKSKEDEKLTSSEIKAFNEYIDYLEALDLLIKKIVSKEAKKLRDETGLDLNTIVDILCKVPNYELDAVDIDTKKKIKLRIMNNKSMNFFTQTAVDMMAYRTEPVENGKYGYFLTQVVGEANVKSIVKTVITMSPNKKDNIETWKMFVSWAVKALEKMNKNDIDEIIKDYLKYVRTQFGSKIPEDRVDLSELDPKKFPRITGILKQNNLNDLVPKEFKEIDDHS